MSRIGKNPISIPQGVTVEIKGATVFVKGSKGELNYTHRPEVEVAINDNDIITTITGGSDEGITKEVNAYWGLTRAIVNNMIVGVTQGFEKKLELAGVGYRVKANNKNSVTITVGFSHPVEFVAPQGIELEVDGNTNLKVKGIDKQLVGLTAAKIRSVRKPEPYKGKGIKYADEIVRRKPGKAGKA